MVLSLFTVVSPMVDIAVIAILITIFSTIVQKKTGVKKEQKEMQKEMKEKQKKLMELQKEGKTESPEFKKLQQEIMSSTMNMMKKSFKPMLITMIVILPVFAFIKWNYGAAIISLPVLAYNVSWFWWYIIISIGASIIIGLISKYVKTEVK